MPPNHQICMGNWIEKCFPNVSHGKMNRVHSDFPAAGGEALQACLLRQAPGAAQSLSPRVYKQISPCMLMLGSFSPQSKFLITTGAHCPQQVARIVQIILLLRA